MGVEVRLAVPEDAEAIGEVFSRAFANDPVTNWVTPDARRRALVLLRMNTAIARYEGVPRGATCVAVSGGVIVGAAIWQPPSFRALSWRGAPFALIAGAALGRDIGRTIAAGRAAANARPREPHWYLQLLGVDPSSQRNGAGSALVREQLRVVDGRRLPACLETTVENIAFYQRMGFGVVGDIVIRDGAPKEYSLMRPSAASVS